MKTLTTIAIVIALAALPAFAQQKASTISREDATKTALKQFPGGIVKSAELETEAGKQVWSFDIEVDKKIHEIWIDAHTGAIVKTESESSAAEAGEKGMDRAEKIALKEIPGEVVKKSSSTAKKQPVFEFLIKGKRGQDMIVDVSKKTYKVIRVTPAALEAKPGDTTKR
jgi:uncharacterized membrane protein YkoI